MFNKDTANLQKGEIQYKAVGLSEAYDNLLLNWATGTGKTYATLKILDRWVITNSMGMPPRIYIVLKEIAHHRNWRDEFIKHGREDYLDHIRFFCYASLHKFADTDCDILILDECHALSEMREDYLKTITCDKIISLSATIRPEVVQRIANYKESFYQYSITLEDAIKRGILPEPTIYVAYAPLNNSIKNLTWRQRKSNPRRGVEYVTAQQYYNKLDKQIEMYKKKYEKGADWAQNRMIRLMGDRKRFIASQKTDAASLLMQNIADKRYICFCGSIEQANELGSSSAIHSKMERKEIEEALSLFQDGKTRHIYAVGMLREAMNLTNIEAAVIVQLDNQQGSFEQMTGRSLRSIAPEVYILVLRGTKDEDYLDKATRGMSSKYIQEYSWGDLEN